MTKNKGPRAADRAATVPSNYHKVTYGQQVESKCRIFSQYEETMDHIVSGCEVLAKKEYISRHNNAAAYLHWSICKDHDIEISDKWYLQESETVMHNKGKKVLNKVLEQFEQYYNPRKNVVFERHQFWQIQKAYQTLPIVMVGIF